MNKTKIILRIDDIGASTKQFNQHGKVYWTLLKKKMPVAFFANWLFFKRIKPFRNWGVYPELNAKQWLLIYDLLKHYNAKMTVGVTACWAQSHNDLIPFDRKFPDEYSLLKEGLQEGLIEIANHGLTHCVLKDNLFYPKMFSSNRKFHREFWDWLPESIHKNHIEKSQEILSGIFQTDIVTFIPPGNVWTELTEMYAKEYGIKYLSSLESKAPTGKKKNGLIYVGNANMIDFHDREISLFGIEWLKKQLEKNQSSNFCTVKGYLDN